MVQQLARHSFGRGAKVNDDRTIVGNRRRAGARNRCLSPLVQAAAFVIAQIGHTRARHSAAVHPVQITRVGQFGQVAADGLQGDIKALCKVFNHHTAFGFGDIQNFALPKT